MNKTMIRKSWTFQAIFTAVLLIFAIPGLTQTPVKLPPRGYSLEEAVNFSIRNSPNIKLSRFDNYIALKNVKDYLGIAMPQVNASFSFQDQLKLPISVLDVSKFPSSPGTPAIPEGTLVPAVFGLQYNGSAGLSLSQLVVDGNLFLGLKASRIYADLTAINVDRTAYETAYEVTKAYYTALLANKSLDLMDINLSRIKEVWNNTKTLFETGLVEKIDADRMELAYSNLLAEKQKMIRLAELSLDMLKFQMGLDVNTEIVLTDIITEDMKLPSLEEYSNPGNYHTGRHEWRILSTQQKLYEINARRIRLSQIPTIAVFGNFNLQGASNKFTEMWEMGIKWNPDFDLPKNAWYPNATVGLSITMPVFNGFRGQAQAQAQDLEAQKVMVQKEQFQQAVTMEVKNAQSGVFNAYDQLQIYKRNYDLALEIHRVTSIKYTEGVGSNLEVIEAESSLREARTHYLTALYEYIIAKTDLAKAKGELLKK